MPAKPPVQVACTSCIDFGTAAKPINIVMWYVFESPGVMQSLATQYQALHPYVTVTTIQYPSLVKYQEQLGLKSGTVEAPDVFFIRHDWLPLYILKLAPITDINLKREPDPSDSVDTYLKPFLPAVMDDMVKTVKSIDPATKKEVTKKELYGIPWGYEGIALFINTDHFEQYNRANPGNQVKIPIPTETMNWEEFANAAQRLIKTNTGWARVSNDQGTATQIDYKNVTRYGAALGNATNVQHATDIFTAMLKQANVTMVADDKLTVEFIKSQNITASVNALKSFTGYNTVWDKTWPSSMESFAADKVSMAFGRSYQIPGVEKNSALHFEVVPFPQRSTDTASWAVPAYYWTRVVNKNSTHVEVSWDFIKFVASKEEMQVYSESTKLPPARSDLPTSLNLGSAKYNIFTASVPYAFSWPQGEPDAAEKIMGTAINDMADGKTDAQSALNKAASDLTVLLNNPDYQL